MQFPSFPRCSYRDKAILQCYYCHLTRNIYISKLIAFISAWMTVAVADMSAYAEYHVFIPLSLSFTASFCDSVFGVATPRMYLGNLLDVRFMLLEIRSELKSKFWIMVNDRKEYIRLTSSII